MPRHCTTVCHHWYPAAEDDQLLGRSVVTGLGESASFRNAWPHESLRCDILTGAGELLTVSPGQHSDLYRAFPNSYGTLAAQPGRTSWLVRLLVALRHIRLPGRRRRWWPQWSASSTPADWTANRWTIPRGVVFSATKATQHRHADERTGPGR